MTLITNTIAAIRPLDAEAMQQARARQDRLTKPQGSLGKLEALSIQLAGITGDAMPRVARKAIIVMAGDHGVTAEGVSAYPSAVTPQMVANFLRGGAAINVLARHVGARVVVVDMGVAADLAPHPALLVRKLRHGTDNFARGPAMSRADAERAIAIGIEIVSAEIANGLDIVGTGEMGIGNTTAASTIIAAMTGRPVAAVTGRGTGVDDAGLARKVAVIERALAVNGLAPHPFDSAPVRYIPQGRQDKPNPPPPLGEGALNVLAKVGGFEIAGLVGVMLGAAARRVPVVVDGFITGAAALLAVTLAPQAKDYLIAAHCSVEIGHRVTLDHIGLSPLLDFDMRLGEGTGAALAMTIVDAACKLLAEMATFDEAGVSEKN